VLKISRLFILSLLLAAMAVQQSVAADDRASVVIRDISVLTAGGWLTHRDIVVRDTTISAVHATGGNVPPAKVVINGHGKFAVPGLFDNRVNLAEMSREAAGLFVAYGVTSVHAGADSPRIAEWRRDIAHGKFMGPRIVESVAGASVSVPGSNAGSAKIAPGQALHDELSRLVKTGLTPGAALRRVTMESARAHGRDADLGSIDVGKIADLLILNDDPLVDISRTRAIDSVVFRGEALTRAHLNLLLSKAQSAGAAR
jgi:imidazolonepropionase-like amidohydrolase